MSHFSTKFPKCDLVRNPGSLGTDELCERSRSCAPETDFVRGDRRREVGGEKTDECRGLITDIG